MVYLNKTNSYVHCEKNAKTATLFFAIVMLSTGFLRYKYFIRNLKH